MNARLREAVSDYLIEPEVAAPVPRTVRLPIGTRALLSSALLVLLLFGCFEVGVLVQAIKLVWLELDGAPVTAVIMSVETHATSAKVREPIQTSYRYQLVGDHGPVDNLTHVARIQYSTDMLPSSPDALLNVGERIPFRRVAWAGEYLVYPWAAPPIGQFVFFAGSGVFILGFCAIFMRKLNAWYKPRTHLLRHGAATVGTIIHKRISPDESPRCYLRYGYAGAHNAVGTEHEEQCSLEQWRKFEIGQPVTVLYDPRRPGLVGLYGLIAPR